MTDQIRSLWEYDAVLSNKQIVPGDPSVDNRLLPDFVRNGGGLFAAHAAALIYLDLCMLFSESAMVSLVFVVATYRWHGRMSSVRVMHGENCGVEEHIQYVKVRGVRGVGLSNYRQRQRSLMPPFGETISLDHLRTT